MVIHTKYLILDRFLNENLLNSFQLALVACAYNVEKDVDKFRKHIEPIINLFHTTSRIIILESDSTDNTLAKLRRWSRTEIYQD